MKAFFIAFKTFLTPAQLAAKRRKFFKLLAEKKIEVRSLKIPKNIRQLISQLILESKAAPIVVMADEYSLPDKAPWLADLTREALTLESRYRPQLIYLTRKATAAGAAQAARHAVIRKYIERDDKGRWIETAAEAVLDLAKQFDLSELPQAMPTPAQPDIVGVSPCFREAVEELGEVIDSPYGLVTGEQGVGKMFLIRAMWKQLTGKSRVIVLPCGSFFKDYYVAGVRRRIAGGREAVDELRPYIKEAHNGLLVLHHVEQLPTALQEELAVRLASSTAGTELATRIAGVDSDGLQEYDVRVIATSTYSPALLLQTGRIIPDLAAKLRKRHVHIPSLAERGVEDVRLLCDDILRRIGDRRKISGVPRMDEAAASFLVRSAWPGNISDLVRVMEYALRRSRGGTIRLGHLPKDFADGLRPARTRPTLDEMVIQAQSTAIENALEQTGGNVAAAAKLLGRNEKALYRLMRRLGMRIPGIKTNRGC